MNDKKEMTQIEAQLKFAKSSFNGIWELLDKTKRTPDDDENMLLGAFASLYHWKQVGSAVNLQRGYWMISRVYQVLGSADQALQWAIKCQAVTEDNPSDMEDYDFAFAQECLARAYALADDLDRAKEHFDLAVDLGKKIEDPEDRELFTNDLQGGNWYQFSSE